MMACRHPEWSNTPLKSVNYISQPPVPALAGFLLDFSQRAVEGQGRLLKGRWCQMRSHAHDFYGAGHDTEGPGNHSVFFFVLVLMLLGVVGYLFVQYVIPTASRIILAFIRTSLDLRP